MTIGESRETFSLTAALRRYIGDACPPQHNTRPPFLLSSAVANDGGGGRHGGHSVKRQPAYPDGVRVLFVGTHFLVGLYWIALQWI